MIIKNASVFSESHSFIKRDIHIHGDFITTHSSSNTQEIDAEGLYAIPGLIDIHLHGCMGYDFCDGSFEAFENIARYEVQNGVTAITPATMTLDEETLSKICKASAEYPWNAGAMFCGINLEGPFLSAAKKGAQKSDFLHKPDVNFFRRLDELSKHRIKLVAIAPELEGAMEFIKELKNDVTLSIAHTCANYDTALTAFNVGASHVTHLFNAMPPFSHRETGVVGAAFDSPHSLVEIICDGLHNSPTMIRSTFKLFEDRRVILVSDSMRATGMPEGVYDLGGQNVTVKDGKALLEGGTIAGSTTHLMDCLRTAVSFGIPLESAIKAATINPAKAIKMDHILGSITPGKYANIVLLDKDLNIKGVFLKGKRFI